MIFLHKSLSAALAPFVVQIRHRIHETFALAAEFSLALDLFFLTLFSVLALLAYCCLIRSAQNIALSILKILLFGSIGLAISHIALALFETSSADHNWLRTTTAAISDKLF